MKQFGKILKFELKNYFVNKTFVGITVFLMVAIILIMFFPRVKEMIGGNEDQSQQHIASPAKEGSVMLIAGEQAELAKEAFIQAFPEYEVQISDAKKEDIKEQIISGEAVCAFVLTDWNSYTYYVDNLSMYDNNTMIADEVLQGIYRMNAFVQGGIPAEDVNAILSAEMKHETETLGKDQMKNYFYTYIMIFALYMVILLYGQMVATNVATEKSSRAMEVLITSAKPVAMMFGKVIASCLAGFIQLVAVFGVSFVSFNLNEKYWDANGIIASLFDMPIELLIYMLVFFVLGFFIYAFMFGAVGSTASKLEDINTSVMPITFLFVAAFIIVMTALAGNTVDTPLMIACSYIPFTSPMAMFTRIAMSTVPAYEIAISIAILIASVIGVGVLSAKIYRVGVLLYGTPPKMSAILKAVRKA